MNVEHGYAHHLAQNPSHARIDIVFDILDRCIVQAGDNVTALTQPLPAGFLAALRKIWNAAGGHTNHAEWQRVFAILRNAGLTIATPAEQEAHSGLPALVEAWRGFSAAPTCR